MAYSYDEHQGKEQDITQNVAVHTPADDNYGGQERDPIDQSRRRHFQRQRKDYSSEPKVG